MKDHVVFERFVKDIQNLKHFENFFAYLPCPISKDICKCTQTHRMPNRFNPLIDLKENKFRIKYRFTKDNLRRIIEIVRDDLEIEQTLQTKSNQVPVELQILAAIRLWGGTEHPEITAMNHGVKLCTLNKICKRVASVLSSKASRYIRMPVTLSEKEMVMRSFQDLANMPQVIGALGYASVKFYQNSLNSTVNFAQLQIVCDASLKIRDLDLKLSNKSDRSSDIFVQSRIKERFEQNEFRGRLLLGNETLPCTPYLLTPVNYPTIDLEDLYNRAHITTYAPAIRSIDSLFKRFGILSNKIYGSFGAIKQTITALALLHNMAMEWNDPSLGVDGTGLVCDQFLKKSPEFTFCKLPSDERTRNDFIRTNF